MYFSMPFPSSPTIMDRAMDFKLTDDQLVVLNNARLNQKLIHIHTKESYNSVDWPKRKVSSGDVEYLYSFIRNSMPPVGRHITDEVKPLCHVQQVRTDKRLGRTITIAYDGSRWHNKMAASISVFLDKEEIFHFTQKVHG